MDPDANLREPQTIAHRIIENHYTQDDAERLADLVSAMDDWLCRGGFLPREWEASRGK